MRFAALAEVVGDVDRLSSSLEQAVASGVELVIVLEAPRTDELLGRLDAAARRVEVVLGRASDDPGRARDVTDIAIAAGVDWILPIGSDDYWLPRSGALGELQDLDGIDVVTVMRYAVVLRSDGPLLPASIGLSTYAHILLYARPIGNIARRVRRDPSTPWIRRLLMPRVMARPSAAAALFGQGPQDDPRWRRAVSDDLLVASVPPRSALALEREVREGGRRHDQNAQPADGESWLAARLTLALEEGRIEEEFANQLVDDEQLRVLRESGEVRSAEAIFDRLVPHLSDEPSYLATVQGALPWTWAAGRICRREGFGFRGRLEHRAGHRPSVLVPPDHLVKFYSTWKDGRGMLERETRALRIAERDPELPAPRIVAAGAFDDEWRYLVLSTRLGIPFSYLSASLAPSDVVPTAAWLGRFVRRMRAIAITPEERASASAFIQAVEERHARAGAMMADRKALPERLIDQIAGWLPSVETMVGGVEDLVLTHSDLNEDHIIGELSEGVFEAKAVIDLGSAVVAHPLYELGPIWWSVLQAHPVPTSAFLTTAGFQGMEEHGFPKLALAWCLIHPPWNVNAPTGLEDVSDLDELARVSFPVTARGAWEPPARSGDRADVGARRWGANRER